MFRKSGTDRGGQWERILHKTWATSKFKRQSIASKTARNIERKILKKKVYKGKLIVKNSDVSASKAVVLPQPLNSNNHLVFNHI